MTALASQLSPHIADVDLLFRGLDLASGRDLKSVRKVSEEFIDLLNQFPIFNVSFILNRDRRLAKDERGYFRTKIEALKRQVGVWNETTPGAVEFTQRLGKKLGRMDQEVNSKSVNLKLLRDTEIIATIAGYLASALSLFGTEHVTWFSDRDSVLSHLTTANDYPLAFDFAHTMHHALCGARGLNPNGIMVFGVPEMSGEMWYDPLVRIPDLICGTLADFNTATHHTSHPKFTPVLQEIFLNRERNAFYRLGIHADGCRFSQLEFLRSEGRAEA